MSPPDSFFVFLSSDEWGLGSVEQVMVLVRAARFMMESMTHRNRKDNDNIKIKAVYSSKRGEAERENQQTNRARVDMHL